jgi:hypothetical protein
VAGTWYNKGGSLAVPIGRWWVEYAAELEVTRAAAGALDVFATHIGILNILIARGILYFDCYKAPGVLVRNLSPGPIRRSLDGSISSSPEMFFI